MVMKNLIKQQLSGDNPQINNIKISFLCNRSLREELLEEICENGSTLSQYNLSQVLIELSDYKHGIKLLMRCLSQIEDEPLKQVNHKCDVLLADLLKNRIDILMDAKLENEIDSNKAQCGSHLGSRTTNNHSR